MFYQIDGACFDQRFEAAALLRCSTLESRNGDGISVRSTIVTLTAIDPQSVMLSASSSMVSIVTSMSFLRNW